MKFIKKYYLLLLLIITLAGATIYGTYAMFTSSVETNMVNMDTNMVYKFKINGTQELKVSAGSKLRFNAIVENDMDGKISYGMYYKMISPATLPSRVIIAQVSDDLTMLAKGQLESGTSKTVPMVIKNTSDSEITVEIGVRTGYATDSQGPDDIIYNEGEIPITSFQTSAEAGSDSCTSTKTCTSECVERIENGYKNTYCYCLDSSVEYNPAKDTLEKLGLTSNSGTPDFSKVATSDEGMYAAQDDYGTSYYFRGAVQNNYVKFANKYWRIIRINGDGSIRLIYDGTRAHANGESSTDRQIGTSEFNYTYGDNAYVGYMMGIDNQCTSGSCEGSTKTTSYNQAHSNTYSSTIKKTVDDWYKTNIQDAGYSDKVADVIYCNDRSLYSGNGYGTNETIYMSGNRIHISKSPILTCSQKKDRFTVNDTTKGNGALTYPVGLITADEVSMAGGVYNTNNNSYYLCTGNFFWVMSPLNFNGNIAREWSVSSNGFINNSGVAGRFGVRPVLSLKSSVTLTGRGTQSDPWVLS